MLTRAARTRGYQSVKFQVSRNIAEHKFLKQICQNKIPGNSNKVRRNRADQNKSINTCLQDNRHNESFSWRRNRVKPASSRRRTRNADKQLERKKSKWIRQIVPEQQRCRPRSRRDPQDSIKLKFCKGDLCNQTAWGVASSGLKAAVMGAT